MGRPRPDRPPDQLDPIKPLAFRISKKIASESSFIEDAPMAKLLLIVVVTLLGEQAIDDLNDLSPGDLLRRGQVALRNEDKALATRAFDLFLKRFPVNEMAPGSGSSWARSSSMPRSSPSRSATRSSPTRSSPRPS